METKYKYIKDGYLVIGTVNQVGCVSYTHRDRQVDREGDRLEVDWRTHKVVLSEEEQRQVGTTRRAMVRRIQALGTTLPGFGVYVPIVNGQELEDVLQDIYAEVSKYNQDATFTRLNASFTVFQVTGGDERVARALYDQTIDCLNQVSESVAKGDIKGMRKALNKMKGIDRILPGRTGDELSRQIKNARSLARKAVKQIQDVTNEEKASGIANGILEEVNFDGVRASLVETIEDITQESEGKTFVPDLADARQIEVDQDQVASDVDPKFPIVQSRDVE